MSGPVYCRTIEYSITAPCTNGDTSPTGIFTFGPQCAARAASVDGAAGAARTCTHRTRVLSRVFLQLTV